MLVSCIMPTRDRAAFVPGAVACWLSQTWRERELIVIDNGEHDIYRFVHGVPGVVYRRITESAKIGALRNMACELARGEFIAHWDDDDWHGPARLAEQVLTLRQSERPATGYNVMPFADDRIGKAWMYEGSPGYACGTSLMYSRAFWRGHRFAEMPRYGEDNDFIRRMDGRLISDSRYSIVARIHGAGTSPRDLTGWTEINYAGLAGFGYPVMEAQQHERVATEVDQGPEDDDYRCRADCGRSSVPDEASVSHYARGAPEPGGIPARDSDQFRSGLPVQRRRKARHTR